MLNFLGISLNGCFVKITIWKHVFLFCFLKHPGGSWTNNQLIFQHNPVKILFWKYALNNMHSCWFCSQSKESPIKIYGILRLFIHGITYLYIWFYPVCLWAKKFLSPYNSKTEHRMAILSTDSESACFN